MAPPRDFDARGPHGEIAGRSVVSFASNDYLGLSAHPLVIDAARQALERWGAGSGSARLIVGSRPIHTQLERELADWKDAEKAVLFPNGYATNLGVLSTFGTEDTLICSDELNHASIVDGCRPGQGACRRLPAQRHARSRKTPYYLRARHRRQRHGLLDGRRRRPPGRDDGHVCALRRVAGPRRGPRRARPPASRPYRGGRPRRNALEIRRRFWRFRCRIDRADGTACQPGAAVIFTTASSPADAAAALAGVELLRSAEGDALRNRLRALVDKVRPGHPSPIIPFVIGDETEAMAASRKLLERGLFVPAIRPPSVPRGTARLRVTISAAHTDAQVDALVDALEQIGAVEHVA